MLSFFLFTSLNLASTIPNAPVCIIGSGVVGLSIARKLNKSRRVIVFEKETEAGGKAKTYINSGGFADIGPLLITKTNCNVLNLAAELGVDFNTVQRDLVYLYDSNVKLQLYNPFNVPNSTIEEEKMKFYVLIQKFLSVRSGIKMEYGYLSAEKSLYVSFYQWLINNDLIGLARHLEPILTVQGYGLISEIPALYHLAFFTVDRIKLMLDPKQEFFIIKNGIQELISKMSHNITIQKDANVFNINLKNKWLFYSNSAGINFQSCSKFIFAVPPTPELMSSLFDKDTAKLFEDVETHNYMTQIYKDEGLTYDYYIEKYNHTSVGSGEVVAVIKQRGLAAAYSWDRYYNKYNKTDSSCAKHQMITKGETFMKKLMDTDNATHLLAKEWIYFPHVSFKGLQNDFFKKLDAIQGKNGLYFASTLLGFELVNDAIGVANYMIEKYFLNDF